MTFDAQELIAAATSDPASMTFGGSNVPVDYDEEKDEFVVKVRPLETERVRQILGARHLRARDEWRMPATRAQAFGLSGVFAGRLESTPAAKAHVHELVEKAAKLEGIRDGNYPGSGATNELLYDYQALGVQFLCEAGSALLGDEMGTGKTIQAIEWMRLQDGWAITDYNLVVCPNSMKFKWVSEIETWWPDANVVAIDGTATQRRKQILGADAPGPTVFVINFESLRSHTKLAPWGGKALTEKQKEPGELNEFRWNCVVVDEAHKIASPSAQQTMAVNQMGLQALYRLAMTGTPLRNDPDDAWSVMRFVAPKEFGSRNQFRQRYCRMATGFHGGYENLGFRPENREEFDSFFRPRFIRRTKTEVLPDLPEKFPIDYRVLPLTRKQKTVYRALSEDFMVMVDGELLTAENPLSLTIRLRQAACAVPIVDDKGDVVALDKTSNKLDAILDILAESQGESIVVYADSRKFIEMVEEQLGKKGFTTAVVTGTQSARDRERAVSDFQSGKAQVFLGTLGAGAEGLTLTRANTIVLAQQSWAHITNAQAIDRIHRIGQDRGVHPIVLVSEGTIDHAVALVDLTKEGRLQELVRDPEWMAKAARGEIR